MKFDSSVYINPYIYDGFGYFQKTSTYSFKADSFNQTYTFTTQWGQCNIDLVDNVRVCNCYFYTYRNNGASCSGYLPSVNNSIEFNSKMNNLTIKLSPYIAGGDYTLTFFNP